MNSATEIGTQPPLFFPEYQGFERRLPIYCVTPDLPGTIHRFYDTSPFSPSGRYLAATRLPFEHRSPRPAEIADVVVVDLYTGVTKIVAKTRGWDVQLGAQVQWGTDDHSLYFNDVDLQTWQPFGIRMDPLTGEKKKLDGTVYMISPDGRWAVSPCLKRTGVTQAGYGVIVPRRSIAENRGASTSDGIYLTNTISGESRLLVSFAQIVAAVEPSLSGQKYERGDFYGFHVKWNPQGTRLLFVLRWLPEKRSLSWLPKRNRHDGLKNVVTMNADGTNIRVAIPDTMWSKGGHHPNWCPDGDHVLMNLNIAGDGLRFVKARYDGATCETLAASLLGSGHPTLHPTANHVLSDAYPKEPVAFADGTVPIRWIDLRNCADTTLARIDTRPTGGRANGTLRVDPHPAWDRSFRRIAFNACDEGRRKVFVADLEELLVQPAIRRAAA